MGLPREHRELGIRETGQVPWHATTEETKELYRALGTDDIGIADDNERGCSDSLEVLLRPGKILRIELLQFLDQFRPVSWVRGVTEVGHFHR
jgi:hypothetical protein